MQLCGLRKANYRIKTTKNEKPDTINNKVPTSPKKRNDSRPRGRGGPF
jgi:hypothetical protein